MNLGMNPWLRRSWPRLPLAGVALLLALATTACEDEIGARPVSSAAISCDTRLANVVALIRADSDAVDGPLDALSKAGCPQHWDAFVEYTSFNAGYGVLGEDACDEMGELALPFVQADGHCLASPPPNSPPGGDAPGAEGAISWQEARRHVGETQRVCGPFAGRGASDDDVFLNIGRDNPDPARFTFVLWDVGTVQEIPSRATLCATGAITLYEGVPQIQLWSKSDVSMRVD